MQDNKQALAIILYSICRHSVCCHYMADGCWTVLLQQTEVTLKFSSKHILLFVHVRQLMAGAIGYRQTKVTAYFPSRTATGDQQRQTAVSAYFLSRQLLLLASARQLQATSRQKSKGRRPAQVINAWAALMPWIALHASPSLISLSQTPQKAAEGFCNRCGLVCRRV